MRNTGAWLGSALALLVLLALVGMAHVGPAALPYPSMGSGDFIEYWSAYQLFRGGGDPYDPALMLELERGLGWSEPRALMMWNPPWLLMLLAPVLALEFGASVRLWLFLAPVLLAASVGLVAAALSRERRVHPRMSYVMAGAAVLFLPALNSIVLGQLGLLLCLAAALLYWALVAGRDGWAAVALVVMSLKPHLFLLLGLGVLWWSVRERRPGPFGGALSILAGLVALTWAINGRALGSWMSTLMAPTESDALIPAADWAGSTLVGILRVMLGAGERWMWIVPLAAALSLAAYLWRKGDTFDWATGYPLLLCYSVFFASFGWLFDHAVLLVPQLAIIGIAFSPVVAPASRRWLLGACLAAQLAIPALVIAGYRSYHHFWWFPGVMLLLTWVALRATDQAPARRPG